MDKKQHSTLAVSQYQPMLICNVAAMSPQATLCSLPEEDCKCCVLGTHSSLKQKVGDTGRGGAGGAEQAGQAGQAGQVEVISKIQGKRNLLPSSSSALPQVCSFHKIDSNLSGNGKVAERSSLL